MRRSDLTITKEQALEELKRRGVLSDPIRIAAANELLRRSQTTEPFATLSDNAMSIGPVEDSQIQGLPQVKKPAPQIGVPPEMMDTRTPALSPNQSASVMPGIGNRRAIAPPRTLTPPLPAISSPPKVLPVKKPRIGTYMGNSFVLPEPGEIPPVELPASGPTAQNVSDQLISALFKLGLPDVDIAYIEEIGRSRFGGDPQKTLELAKQLINSGGEGSVGAGERAFKASALPAVAGFGSFPAGMAIGSKIPGNAAVKAAGGIVGGIGLSLLGSTATAAAQEGITRLALGEDAYKLLTERRQKDKEEHPLATAIGSNLPNALMLKPEIEDIKAIPSFLNAVRVLGPKAAFKTDAGAKVLSGLTARGSNVGASLAIETGRIAAQPGYKFDPYEFWVNVLTGAALPHLNAVGERIGNPGGIVQKIENVKLGKRVVKPAPIPNPEGAIVNEQPIVGAATPLASAEPQATASIGTEVPVSEGQVVKTAGSEEAIAPIGKGQEEVTPVSASAESTPTPSSIIRKDRPAGLVEASDNVTYAANASTQKDRSVLGLAESAGVTPESADQWLAESRQNGYNTPEYVAKTAEQINSGSRKNSLSDAETIGFTERLTELKNQYEDAVKRNDPPNITEPIREQINDTIDALVKSGTEWGRAGVARRIGITQDYRLSTLLWRAERAKGGSSKKRVDLTPEEKASIQQAHQELTDFNARADVQRPALVEEAIQAAEGAKTARTVSRDITKRRQTAKAELDAALKRSASRLSALLGPTPDPEVAYALGKYLRTYLHEGLFKVDEILSRSKKDFPDIEKSDVLTALEEKNPDPKSRSKSELLRLRNALNKEVRDIRRAENPDLVKAEDDLRNVQSRISKLKERIATGDLKTAGSRVVSETMKPFIAEERRLRLELARMRRAQARADATATADPNALLAKAITPHLGKRENAVSFLSDLESNHPDILEKMLSDTPLSDAEKEIVSGLQSTHRASKTPATPEAKRQAVIDLQSAVAKTAKDKRIADSPVKLLSKATETITDLEEQLRTGVFKDKRTKAQVSSELEAARKKVSTLRQKIDVTKNIRELERQLAKGEFVEAQPKKSRQADIGLKKLRDEEKFLKEQIQARIDALNPQSFGKKASHVVGSIRLMNPVSRIIDLVANSAKVADFLTRTATGVTPAVDAITSKVLRVPKVGYGIYEKDRISRIFDRTGAEMAHEAKMVLAGTDRDTAGKLGLSSKGPIGIGSKAAGLTDVPFKAFYTQLAEDYGADIKARQELGKSGTRDKIADRRNEILREIQEKGDHPEISLAAHEFALRETLNSRNLTSDTVGHFHTLTGKAFGEDVGDLVNFAADELFLRFSKVITNVATDAIDRTGYGMVRSVTELARAKKDIANGVKEIPLETRLKINELASKGFSGLATTVLGVYLADTIRKMGIGQVKDSKGGKYVDFGDVGKAGGAFSPLLYGVTWKIAQEEKDPNILWKTYMTLPLNTPLASNFKTIGEALNSQQAAKVFGARKLTQMTGLSNAKDIARMVDQKSLIDTGTGVERQRVPLDFNAATGKYKQTGDFGRILGAEAQYDIPGLRGNLPKKGVPKKASSSIERAINRKMKVRMPR